MHIDDPNHAETLAPEVLKAIVDTALFYPCCGQDLDLPIQLFASAVSDFFSSTSESPVVRNFMT